MDEGSGDTNFDDAFMSSSTGENDLWGSEILSHATMSDKKHESLLGKDVNRNSLSADLFEYVKDGAIDEKHAFNKSVYSETLQKKILKTNHTHDGFLSNLDVRKSLVTGKNKIDITLPMSTARNTDYLIDFWLDFDNGAIHTLPIIGPGSSDSMYRIECTTLQQLIDSHKNYKIIDCRYPYEYEGGHIKGALNINFKDGVDRIIKEFEGCIVVFYCEFSSVRAPKMACELRNVDRKLSKYPYLKFPEIYILDGGYSKFFKLCSSYCEPRAYVSMSQKGKKITK